MNAFGPMPATTTSCWVGWTLCLASGQLMTQRRYMSGLQWMIFSAEADAIPLYRQALDIGLDTARRPQALIQLAS